MSRKRHAQGSSQPRRHRMRKQARRDSARVWVDSGARVTVKTYAKRYGVDRYTAYDDLVAIGVTLPAAEARWAVRPPSVPKRRGQQKDPHTDELDGVIPGWVEVGSRRMFAVDVTSGGFPIGWYEEDDDGWLDEA
ncbi:MAG: hypothetical protein ACRDZ4_09420 [Egibacteraceae bacterium]